MVVYTTNPQTAIPSLMARAESFGKISGYKINVDKTEVMDWNQGDSQGAKPQMRNLGILITEVG